MKATEMNETRQDLKEHPLKTPRPFHRVFAHFGRRKKPPVFPLIVLLVLCVAALGAALHSAYQRQQEMLAAMERELDDANSLIRAAQPVITSETVSQSVNSLRELVTREYLYTNAGKYENHNEVSISSITVGVPLTKKSFTVVYDGRIKAGIDLSKAQISVNDTLRSVTVTLPASEITSHEIFEDTVLSVDERDALFNRNTIDDYNDFLIRQKAAMEEKVRATGFLANADREAREIVRSVLSLLPGMDTYRLTVQ